ncbi:MAG: heme-binding protein [Acidobacteriota bacterium]
MRKWTILTTTLALAGLVMCLGSGIARAQQGNGNDDDDNSNDSRAACQGLPTQVDLKNALVAARGQNSAQTNGGFGLHMWATIVNRDGVVCAVAFTGNVRSDQWPGSRAISAQKANTANAFSLPGLVLSTANIYSAVQPGGSLAGLQESNPVNTDVAYRGNVKQYGQGNDPMVGGRIGGINIFGGGLGLYRHANNIIGALGVSGDSSCADHNIAWRVRNILQLDYLPGGVSGDATRPDNIVYDIATLAGHSTGVSAGGWGHPACSSAATAIAGSLPVKRQ